MFRQTAAEQRRDRNLWYQVSPLLNLYLRTIQAFYSISFCRSCSEHIMSKIKTISLFMEGRRALPTQRDRREYICKTSIRCRNPAGLTSFTSWKTSKAKGKLGNLRTSDIRSLSQFAARDGSSRAVSPYILLQIIRKISACQWTDLGKEQHIYSRSESDSRSGMFLINYNPANIREFAGAHTLG